MLSLGFGPSSLAFLFALCISLFLQCAMASIHRLLSIAACEVDEDAEFWTEELIGCLAVELRPIEIETGVELRLGFPEHDSIVSDEGQLCLELISGWDQTRLQTLLIALATTNWVPFEVRDAPILNQVCVKKRSLCGALVENIPADVAAIYRTPRLPL